MRLARVQRVVAALLILVCVAGVLLVPDRGQRFVVPGAYDVRVARPTVGVRVVTFRVPAGTPDWADTLDRSLRAQGWLPPDYSGAVGQFTIYTHIMSFFSISVWEEAQIGGDAQQARITLRRWLRVAWPKSLSINF